MNPLVSVVIPAFNAAGYVSQAVTSVLDQTFRDFEVIVIDDGSRDNTREVLGRFGDRIRCECQENRGVYAARNRGLALARGRYVAFLDADDVWLPEKLERQVEVLEASLEFGAVHTDTAVMDAEGRIVKPSANPRRQSQNGWVFEEFFRRNMAVILLSTVLIRKGCFEKTGRFDERYPVVQDYVFFLRLAWHYPIYFLRQPLVKYRITPGSLSRRNAVENVSVREQLLSEFIAEHRDYFAARPALLRRKWRSFSYDAGRLLFHAGHYAHSHRYFRRALGAAPKPWLYYLATALPERFLRRRTRGVTKVA